MKKSLTVVAALIATALVLPAVAAAAPKKPEVTAKQAAKAECLAEKRADKAAFKATYGKRAMRTCVKGEKAEAKDEIRNASQECKAERAEDPAAFAEKYGSNDKSKGKGQGKNALGKCVSSKVKEDSQEDVAEFKNAAKECKAERAADPAGFKETYGTNRNGKNALGKCVSSKVKDGEDGGQIPV